MFTPFAFIIETPPTIITSVLGYYIGGNFTSYATPTNPYFRMLDSTGSISSSFNTGIGFNGAVTTAATQSDQKIIVGGNFNTYSGSSITRIVRLNPDGTRDTTLNTGNVGGTVNSVAVQTDQKIIMVGNFTSYSGSVATRIARLNPNGTIDTNFVTGTGLGFTPYSTTIQPDGKILVGGTFTTYSGSTVNRIARINTDGTNDTGSSWNTGIGFNNAVVSIAIQSDQKIVVGGSFTTYSGSTTNYIARLNTDGTQDTTFNIGTGFNGGVNSLAIQSDQKIIAVGNFTTYSGSTAKYIARLNSDGTQDTTFNVGTGFNNGILSVTVQSDQKIIAIGNFTAYSGSIVLGVVRLNSDGTRDTTFGNNLSINSTALPSIILPLSNGSIILGSNFIGPKIGYMTFLTPSGNTNSTSSVSANGFNSNVSSMVRQTNGKIVAGGQFDSYSGSSTAFIVRLNIDNTIDTTFNIGTGFSYFVNTLAIQTDQKIIAGGFFTNYSGSTANYLTRLNPDGTQDTTFNVGTGFNAAPTSLAIQPDGKILVGGSFTTYSGSTTNYITRLNTDGTRDTTFNIGTGFNLSVDAIIVQSDGKIVAGGTFTFYSGSAATRIARLNVNGTRDTTFNTGIGFGNPVYALSLQPDQKILVGGNFTTYSGSTANRIARLNVNGTRDTTFTGTGFASGDVFNIQIQPDLKIITGGAISNYNGSASSVGITRINPNGTLDTTFAATPGNGFNLQINSIIPIY